MKAKKGHEIDRMMIIKLFGGNYARDLASKKDKRIFKKEYNRP
jgi:hypothetical protein